MEESGREIALVTLSAEQDVFHQDVDTRCVSHRLKAMCHTDAPLWSAREIASMALPAEPERHTENV